MTLFSILVTVELMVPVSVAVIPTKGDMEFEGADMLETVLFSI